MSGASEQANGKASGPLLQSVFLAVLDPSGPQMHSGKLIAYLSLSCLLNGI